MPENKDQQTTKAAAEKRDTELKVAVCDAVDAAIDNRLGDLTEIKQHAENLISVRGDVDRVVNDVRDLKKQGLERAFDGNGRYRGMWGSEEQARRAGMFLMASLGFGFAREACKADGIELRAMAEDTGAGGGFLVPEDFVASIIRNVEEYGVLWRNAMIVPMSRDNQTWPKRSGGLTVYYPGEGILPTASDLKIDQVRLQARKYMTLTYLSSELDEDAAIAVAELLGDEIALAFALAVDTNGFNGNGTSTYARTNGLLNAVGSAGVATGASGQTTYAAVGYNIFAQAVGKLPTWAAMNARWYMNFSVLWAQLGRTNSSTGELLLKEVVLGGQRIPAFLGMPVEITQVLPATSAGSQTGTKFAVVGDLRRSVMIGNRRQLDVGKSDQYKFGEDQITVRSRARLDVQVAEPGDASKVGGYTVVKTAAS